MIISSYSDRDECHNNLLRNQIFRRFVVRKLKEHGIIDDEQFTNACYDHFSEMRIQHDDFRSLLHQLQQAVRGNLHFRTKLVKFIVIDLLRSTIDDYDVCQYILLGRGDSLHGQRFGKLVVQECVESDGSVILWKCLCDCGKFTIKKSHHLIHGNTKSCGCVKAKLAACRLQTISFKHGYSYSSVYKYYQYLKRICYNEKNSQFDKVGALGIKMCDRWKDSFMNFYEDVGPRPGKARLKRLDDSKDFTPENCYWDVCQ